MGTLHSPKLQHYRNLTIRLCSVIYRVIIGWGDLTPVQRSSRCILTNPICLGHSHLIGGVLLLSKELVGVFYCRSRQDHRTLTGCVLLSNREAVGVFYKPSYLGHNTLIGGVSHLCREAVCVFYSPSRLDHCTFIEGVLLLCREAIGVFYNPSQLGKGGYE